MTERAKKPYEGMASYDAGYRDGYNSGHDDATGISQWYWDENGMDYGLGAWRCEMCGYVNSALPIDKDIYPYNWSGSKYCANCGHRMIDLEQEGD